MQYISFSDNVLLQIENLKETFNKTVAIQCLNEEESDLMSKSLKSISLLPIVSDTFTCLICLGMVQPPVALSICCKRILACKSCNDNWLQRTCPNCRKMDYEVIELICFDGILEKCHQLMP